MRHLLSLFSMSAGDITAVFNLARRLKSELQSGVRQPLLAQRTMALLFEKPSLRTRVSFECAMNQLGGGSLFLGKDVGWGERESTADFAQVLAEYVDVVVCRAKSHQRVEELARFSQVPVINGLTNTAHPCQALADLFTLDEAHSSLAGLRLAYVGDCNNVAASLAVACGRLGVELAVATPEGYGFSAAFRQQLQAQVPELQMVQTPDPREAVRGAHGVYTDVWTSMGQESERAQRLRAFESYQVTPALMAEANRDACFLHCLPARRGEEVTEQVIDGTQSRVIAQAANRMHVQKGILVWLLTKHA